MGRMCRNKRELTCRTLDALSKARGLMPWERTSVMLPAGKPPVETMASSPCRMAVRT